MKTPQIDLGHRNPLDEPIEYFTQAELDALRLTLSGYELERMERNAKQHIAELVNER